WAALRDLDDADDRRADRLAGFGSDGQGRQPDADRERRRRLALHRRHQHLVSEVLMRRILAALALVAGAGAAQAQTTVSGPITFGTVFSVSGAGTVSIAPGGITGTMLASGIALPSATLPGSGQITSAGALGLGAAPNSILSVNANSAGATAASVTGGGVIANLIGA